MEDDEGSRDRQKVVVTAVQCCPLQWSLYTSGHHCSGHYFLCPAVTGGCHSTSVWITLVESHARLLPSLLHLPSSWHLSVAISQLSTVMTPGPQVTGWLALSWNWHKPALIQISDPSRNKNLNEEVLGMRIRCVIWWLLHDWVSCVGC